MKTYIEIEEKKIEYEEKFNRLKKANTHDKNALAKYCDWIDLLNEFLVWNISKFTQKNQYDFNLDAEIAEFTDEIKQELVISESEAIQRLDSLKKSFNYNSNITSRMNILKKTEIEILNWILE